VFGTLTNGFINYVALRNYYDADEAWKAMGMYGGDDGVTFDLPPNAVKKTAAMFGMAFDAEAVPVTMPIKFLGRIYPDLSTTTQSICDVARQARKLHLTATPDMVPFYLALYRKAQGYLCTDTDTPFITPWCRAVVRLCAPLCPEAHRLYKQTAGEENYWAKYEAPFETLSDETFKYGIVSSELGLTVNELLRYEDVFNKATRFEDLYLADILKLKTSVAIIATLNGEIMRPTPRKRIPDIVDEHLQLSPKLCRFVERGQECRRNDCKFSHESPRNGHSTSGSGSRVKDTSASRHRPRSPPRNRKRNGKGSPPPGSPKQAPTAPPAHFTRRRTSDIKTTTDTVKSG